MLHTLFAYGFVLPLGTICCTASVPKRSSEKLSRLNEILFSCKIHGVPFFINQNYVVALLWVGICNSSWLCIHSLLTRENYLIVVVFYPEIKFRNIPVSMWLIPLLCVDMKVYTVITCHFLQK